MYALTEEFNKFNQAYHPDKHAVLTRHIEESLGKPPGRMCETPIFLSAAQFEEIIQSSKELIAQAMEPTVLEQVEPYVMQEFKLQERPAHPSFILVDFAMTKDEAGNLKPKLVEMQSSSSLFLFMMTLAEEHKQIHGLGKDYEYLAQAKTKEKFIEQIRESVLGTHAPKHVALLDIDPPNETSLVDYNAFEKIIGLKVLGVRDVIKRGGQLFYKDGEEEVRIERMYNRVIPEDFAARNLRDEVQFTFTEKLNVEWISHPHWDFLMSKASLPFMEHPALPKTFFLDQVTQYPEDLQNYVLKPLFAYGGKGVKVNITAADLDAIPAAEKKDYVLMEKINYEPFIESPSGQKSKAEIRLMFTWCDTRGLEPAIMLGRVSRGDKSNMSGAAFTAQDNWIGLAPVLKKVDGKPGNFAVS